MSSFPNVTIPPGVWTNLSVAVGIDAGVGLLIQNKSAYPALVEESSNAPDDTHVGFDVLRQGDKNDVVETSPASGQSIWARPVSSHNSSILHMEALA